MKLPQYHCDVCGCFTDWPQICVQNSGEGGGGGRDCGFAKGQFRQVATLEELQRIHAESRKSTALFSALLFLGAVLFFVLHDWF